MFRKIFFLPVLLLIILNWISAFELPFDLSADASGIDYVYNGTVNEIYLKFKYSLNNLQKSDFTANNSFIFPIPGSNDLQKVTVMSFKGFQLKDFVRDRFGNTVVLTEPFSALQIPETFEINLKIKTQPAKFLLPEHYRYHLKINPEFLNALATGQNNAMMIKLNEKTTYADIMKLAEVFKKRVNQTERNIDKIYDKKISELYPVEKKVYRQAAQEFMALLKKNNIICRLGEGWNFYEKIDRFPADFILEIFLPEYGMIAFNSLLDPLNYNGVYLNWLYHLNGEYTDGVKGYLGALDDNNGIQFFPVEIMVTGGLYDPATKKIDSRFNRVFDQMETEELEPIQLSSFTLNGTGMLTADSVYWVMIRESEKREYLVKAANQLIDKLTFCTGFANNKPVGTGSTFPEYARIYAWIEFKDREHEKNLYYRWIKPDNQIFFEQKLEVNRKWGYTYLTINYNQKLKLMKGLWYIEIFINGTLDARNEFVIK